jgi:uncharacterized protein YkwD
MVEDRHVGPRSTLLLVVIALLVAAVLPGTVHSAGRAGSTGTSLAELEGGVLAELNSIRVDHGLKPLRLNPALSAAARQHTFEMLADGYFEHESANGLSFWRRIQQFYARGSKGRWSVAENLLWSGGEIGAQRALDAWMASPGHRQNILTAKYREIGIAAVYSSTSSGEFGGSSVTLITTDFGVRG